MSVDYQPFSYENDFLINNKQINTIDKHNN